MNKRIRYSIVFLFLLIHSGFGFSQHLHQPEGTTEGDLFRNFQDPPPGYGEVPFWWWTGDDLDVDRLLWQLHKLSEKGISGVQVNYSHTDEPGWPTDPKEPDLFTDEWWRIYSRISEECQKLGMGIGLSTYTIDWDNGSDNLFHRLFYSKPEFNAVELSLGTRIFVSSQTFVSIPVNAQRVAIWAYPVRNGKVESGGILLDPYVENDILNWIAPDGDWEVWEYVSKRLENSFNPLMKGAGGRIVQGYYQEFENHNRDRSSAGLNYFFNDELQVGTGKFAWNPDFPDEFERRKGYELFQVLPAQWIDLGDITPKVRIDYADVRMSLMEERYFQPIFEWHASRGIVFGCDNHGRGKDPHAYGDYFRACRWYSAPGHDTPMGSADPIKGKVSSSIATLYQRPRVQLEGYHSLGWGATPEQLMFATRENYLYGCNMLSLHGLYYSTHGSFWEWAPPCYHFRMPYWQHMGVFLKYFERLSYLMSQGDEVADVAVVYPVTPYEAGMDGDASRNTAFQVGEQLLEAGINFNFIDHQSLARGEVDDGRLIIKNANAAYRALVIPNMEAMRWNNVKKIAELAESGGAVVFVGNIPSASDRVGRKDDKLHALLEDIIKPEHLVDDVNNAVSLIQNSLVQDVRGLKQTVRALHRKIGDIDLYLVMDANPGDIVEFRAKGRVELWDPWSGNARPLRIVQETATGTQVELPLQSYEAQVVVFDPGNEHVNPPGKKLESAMIKTLPSNDWRVSFVPTMDNRWGDFRLPVNPNIQSIGVEARRFKWAQETPELVGTGMLPETDDGGWDDQMHGFSNRFFLLGPIPESIDPAEVDAKLAVLERVDPDVPVRIDGQLYHWTAYPFSWRFGKEGDPGHQGFHGLKGTISDNFIRLGKPEIKGGGVKVLSKESNNRYYLWTAAVIDDPVLANIHVSETAPPSGRNHSPVTKPNAVFINGKHIEDLTLPVALNRPSNPILLRYDSYGESHFVLRNPDLPPPDKRAVLAMRWYNDKGVIPFDPYGSNPTVEWFRFQSAPGTKAIQFKALSREPIQAWINGEAMIDMGDGRFKVKNPTVNADVVALRIHPNLGQRGGSAIPDPIQIETNSVGQMNLGDWSKIGILNNYSGGICYRKSLRLSAEEAASVEQLDLGKVVATAEVHINGHKVGVLVAPPWKLDVEDYFKPGENTLEVIVYNTLANHYQTIPSLYRGDPASGLMGPVLLVGRK